MDNLFQEAGRIRRCSLWDRPHYPKRFKVILCWSYHNHFLYKRRISNCLKNGEKLFFFLVSKQIFSIKKNWSLGRVIQNASQVAVCPWLSHMKFSIDKPIWSNYSYNNSERKTIWCSYSWRLSVIGLLAAKLTGSSGPVCRPQDWGDCL